MKSTNTKVNMKDSKVIYFTRSEGGTKVPTTFDIYEEDILKTAYHVEKKEVYSKVFKQKIVSRVVKINNIWVHALFFDNGNVYHVTPIGFKLRELEKEIKL